MVGNLFRQGHQFFSRQQTTILSAAAIITLASFLSSIFGLIKTRLLLSHFSATPQLQQFLDAYWVALRLPELLFQLLVIGALSAAFIPVFTKYFHKDEAAAYRISSSVMNVIVLIFSVLGILVFLFARPLTRALTGAAFTPLQVDVATHLTQIMIFAQLLFAISNFLTGVLQAQQRFLLPALSPVAYNIGIIIGIVTLSPLLGIYAAAVGVLVGAFLHLLIQLPLAIRLGFRYHPEINISLAGVKEMFRLMPPRVLAISISQLELSAMVYFATGLSAGSLTILQIAQQLTVAPIRMFAVPIGQASLPFLANHTAKGKYEQFQETFRSSLSQILFLALPASMLLLILRVPLVRIVYGSRQFPWVTTLLTAKTVAILSLSLFAQGLVHLLVRAFYSLHNTRTPFFIGLASVGVNIFLATLVVFRFKLGLIGLAASVTIASILQAGLLLIFLLKDLRGVTLESLLLPVRKMALATIIMGISLWVPMRLLDQFVFDTTRTLNLVGLTIIVSVIGMGVYAIVSKLLKVEAFEALWALAKPMGNWREILTRSGEVLEPASTQEAKPT